MLAVSTEQAKRAQSARARRLHRLIETSRQRELTDQEREELARLVSGEPEDE